MKDFYNKYYSSLKGFISRKIDDEDVIEEIADDVMVAANLSKDNFNGKCSEFTWLCSIAKHKIVDYFRKKRIKTVLFSVSPVFEEIADKALGPERDALKNELKEEIFKTFKEIGKGYKKVLQLKYLQGWKVKKIAENLEVSEKAIESKLVRARKKFKEVWVYDQKKN
jgi:RNA polymerase sigma-70 factor, ECF subfamily